MNTPETGFTLATQNLHRGIGRDGVMSPERCAAVLKEIDADLVVLQEVESRPGHELDALAYLARKAGYRAIAGATMIRAAIHYGDALLSRLQIDDVRSHDLSVCGREPRAVLDVDVRSGPCRAQVIGTHLDLRPSERRAQIRKLLPLVNVNGRDLVVLAGDFNEWFPWGRPARMLSRIFPSSPRRRSWPAQAPLFPQSAHDDHRIGGGDTGTAHLVARQHGNAGHEQPIDLRGAIFPDCCVPRGCLAVYRQYKPPFLVTRSA